jgi:ribosomal protein S18 acetylase RimI-like enzyme
LLHFKKITRRFRSAVRARLGALRRELSQKTSGAPPPCRSCCLLPTRTTNTSTVLSREERFCGVALLWRGPDFVYLEHLAILPELRCQKLGTQAMQQLLRENPCVVLDIEPPDTPLRMRRKAFYERQGFAVNPYPHFQPPMQKDCGRVRLLLLSRPLLDEETHERFLKFFLAKLQKYSDFRAEKAE